MIIFLCIFRHSIFAPSKFDSYASAGLPGLSDLLHKYEELTDEEKEKRKEEIQIHITKLMVMVNQAINLLAPPQNI